MKKTNLKLATRCKGVRMSEEKDSRVSGKNLVAWVNSIELKTEGRVWNICIDLY